MSPYTESNSIAEGSGSSWLKASMAGLSGILRKEQEEWEATDKSLQEAFQGVNLLLVSIKYLFIYLYFFFLFSSGKHLSFSILNFV